MLHFILGGVTSVLAGIGIIGVFDITLFRGQIGVAVSKYTGLR